MSEAEQLQHLMTTMATFFFGIPIFATFYYWLLMRDEPEWNSHIGYCLIPGLNLLIVVLLTISAIHKLFTTPHCAFWGHHFEHVHDSQAQTRTMFKRAGQMPPLSVGGFDRYECTRCQTKRTTKWSAF